MKNQTSFQNEKSVVLEHYAQLDASSPDEIPAAMARLSTPDLTWRGFHPFGEITGPDAVARQFWQPLAQSLAHRQRRIDVFFAGLNQIDDFSSTWVVSMGHILGLFDQPWLGIPPIGRIAMLRYAEFHRVVGDRISETAMYFDIPHLMRQAGVGPFPTQTAQHLVQPGPIRHDGVLFGDHDPAEATATLGAINRMVDDLRDWQSEVSIEDELRRSWHEDMLWWGPEGIGATYTIERYAKQHAGPFRAGFRDRKFNGHIAKLAEGRFGGFFGWPNLTLTPAGGFMGLPGSDIPGDMRVIDIYRREGDKLAENWIFIDLLHFWKSQGLTFLPNETTA